MSATSIEDLVALRKTLKAGSRTVVFTNGVFDILHAGHVMYLEAAKALGDVLIVGLNADESVTRLKGPTRPVNAQDDRAHVLCGLRSVDYVVVFTEDTPLHIIEMLLPDVLVKGGDYTRDTIVGADIVEQHGGIVTTIPLLDGRSTTGILERAQKN